MSPSFLDVLHSCGPLNPRASTVLRSCGRVSRGTVSPSRSTPYALINGRSAPQDITSCMVAERFFEDFPTFTTTNHQPPTLDDNNWLMRIDRESSL